MTPRQTEFIKAMSDHDGNAPYRTFEQFCEMAYCALAKPLASQAGGEALEARYMRLVGVVGDARTRRFAELLGLMTLDLQETGADFLSAVVQDDRVNAVNKHCGQFFTPFEVCRLMAKMTCGDFKSDLKDKPYLSIGEPASGAGGMLLAIAQEAREQGIDITRRLWFDATDISQLCFYMTFIQMAAAGCAGVARCANTLAAYDPEHERALTPGSAAFLMQHGWPQLPPISEAVETFAEQAEPVVEQFALF